MKNPITTHVLDISRGKPVHGIRVVLEMQTPSKEWKELAKGKTNADGRINDLLSEKSTLKRGVYRLTFDTTSYFRSIGASGFYPHVSIVFKIKRLAEHYHIPLLLSPYGYSTYRGS